MPATTLHYGDGRTLRLEVDGPLERGPRGGGGPTRPPARDAAAVRQALWRPLGYPPLGACLAPGDRVTLAVASGVPSPAAVVEGAIAALGDAGVPPERVTVLAETAADTSRFRDALSDGTRAGMTFATHDPVDPQQTAVAGMLSDDRPLVLSRSLVEADVAIPVSSCGAEGAGVFANLYPAFSDKASRDRAAEPPLRRAYAGGRFASTADEAGWLLGVTLALQVTPSRSGGIGAAFAGPANAVHEAIAPVARKLWSRPEQQSASLVIATVTGGEEQQTWASVARALAAAETAALPGAAVAVCSELSEPLSTDATRWLSDASGADEAGFGVGWPEPATDPWPPGGASDDDPGIDGPAHPEAGLGLTGSREEGAAAVERLACELLLAARRRGPVYLMSRLDADWVEEIGLAPVANERELSRLATRRGGCVVLEGAQHVAAGGPARPLSGWRTR